MFVYDDGRHASPLYQFAPPLSADDIVFTVDQAALTRVRTTDGEESKGEGEQKKDAGAKAWKDVDATKGMALDNLKRKESAVAMQKKDAEEAEKECLNCGS